MVLADAQDQEVELGRGWTITLAIFIGGVAYSLLYRFLLVIMYYGFNCEALGELDMVFTHESADNCHIMVGALFLEKFDYFTMREHILRKSEKFDKFQSRLVKKFGLYFFQKMSQEEWAIKQKDVVIHNTEVQSEKELNDLMCREMQNNNFGDHVQYRFILIPDYSQNESVFIMKCQHCMADGLALSSVLLGISDEYDAKALPSLKPLGCFKHAIILLLSPFFVLHTLISVQCKKIDRNSITNDHPRTGIKRGGFTRDLSLKQIKEFCKKKGCTINDYIAAMTCVTLHDYMSNN